MITRLLKRQVVSERFLAQLGQGFCYLGACLIPVLVFRRFGEIEISEAQLLLGVVATMSLAISCTIAGILIESRIKAA